MYIVNEVPYDAKLSLPHQDLLAFHKYDYAGADFSTDMWWKQRMDK
jgi:hypothetical protein